MVRSCLVLLAVYAALFAAYAWWLGTAFPAPGKYIGAGIMALITGGSLGAFYNAWVARREWSLLSAARHSLPWTDGRWTAAVGELHPVGEPLIAPFSGQECVLCEYDAALSSRVQSSSQDGTPGSDFVGFLMNPSVVRSSMGDLRLLGFPNLVGFGERHCTSSEAQLNGRRFLLSTDFENISGLKMISVFSAIKAAWTDDDGLVRKNIRLTSKTPQQLYPEEATATGASTSPVATPEAEWDDNLEEDDDELDDEELNDEELAELGEDLDDDLDFDTEFHVPEQLVLKEKRVKVGERVCAFGIYNGQHRGLVPGGLGADRFIKLVRGKPEAIEASARKRVLQNIVGGILGLTIVHAGAWALLQAAPK
jgi:hypothetical protein